MARMTAVMLRSIARETMITCGGRGFMRFLDDGDMLLVTDALRRCADKAERNCLVAALEGAGFACWEQDGLLLLAPSEAMLEGMTCPAETAATDWRGVRHGAHSLALRWLRKDARPLTQAGRQLIVDCLRLTWQPEERVLAGCARLRAQVALMQRSGDFSGMREAGAILYDWCQEGKSDED